MNLAAIRTRRAWARAEEDRRAVALAIRDDLTQTLAAARMVLLAARGRRPPADNDFSPILQGIEASLSKAMACAALARPLVLEDFGLLAAVEAEVDGLRRRSQAPIQLMAAGDLPLAEPEVTMVLRLVQRLLDDLAAASTVPSKIEIRLSRGAASVQIRTVMDAGAGHRSFGQSSTLGDLCQAYGARLKVAGRGLFDTVTVTLPLGAPVIDARSAPR
jgi:signal transduction histidine kinase